MCVIFDQSSLCDSMVISFSFSMRGFDQFNKVLTTEQGIQKALSRWIVGEKQESSSRVATEEIWGNNHIYMNAAFILLSLFLDLKNYLKFGIGKMGKEEGWIWREN